MSADKNLAAAADFLTKLTGNRVFLLFIAGVIGIFLFTVFENRTVVAASIVSSVPLMIGLSIAGLVIFLSYFFQRLQNRVDEKTEHVHLVLKERIDDLEHQVEDLRDREKVLTGQVACIQVIGVKLEDIHDDVKMIRKER